MSRRVRDWCDICRDHEPDLNCKALVGYWFDNGFAGSTRGCDKKFHEDCLKNAGYWRAEDVRSTYVCPDCRESNSNENYCYICKKELCPASSKKRRRSQAASPRKPAKAAVSETKAETALKAGSSAAGEEEPTQKPRRSARTAARKAAAAKESGVDESDGGEDSGDNDRGRLKKSEMGADEDFMLCDGCSNSAHLSCLGLTEVPQDSDSDLWFCTECDPNSATAASLAQRAAAKRAAALKSSNANASKHKIGGNVDICYVCQKAGKLLGCDFCEQAFHPRCIDAEFLEFENSPAGMEDTTGAAEPLKSRLEAEKWRCPICKGEDPLKNMAHKRLSRTAMLKMQREWQDCIKTTHRKTKLNRDKFLWGCRHALLPFVTQRTLARLKKQFATVTPTVPVANRRVNRRQLRVDTDSDATQSEASSHSNKEGNRKDEELAALAAFRQAEAAAKGREWGGLLKEGVNLKSYQVIGVGWLLSAFHQKAGAILADEMGLGKTIQCLAFLSALKSRDLTGPHLIVVPLSTVGNWAREIRKFVPHLKFVKICGSRFEREHTMTDPTAEQGLYDLYITTYETVVTEEAFFCDNFSWQCLILDEAHRIKNESGRIRHSLDRVSANMRVLLTGTPLQNNVKELFTLLNFLFPDVLKDSDTFEKIFAKKETPGTATQSLTEQAAGIGSEILDASAINAVTHLLGKMMLRRTKDLVVRLPKKFEHDIWIPLAPLSAYWYRTLLDVSEAAFQQQSVKKLLGTVVKMRICCCHPRGLVTRDAQLKRFKEVFFCLDREEEITDQAAKLLAMSGEEHITASSKLTALDKLLVQLHVQNMRVSESYSADFVQNVKDLYIQAHPLRPLPPPPRIIPVKSTSSNVKGAPASKKPSTSPAPESAAADSLAGSEPAGAPASESGVSVVRAASEPAHSKSPPLLDVEKKVHNQTSQKPSSSRQQSEKIRRERAATLAQQQADLEAAVEEAANRALYGLRASARDPDLFFDLMVPAKVSDAPLPSLPDEGPVLQDEEDDDDTSENQTTENDVQEEVEDNIGNSMEDDDDEAAGIKGSTTSVNNKGSEEDERSPHKVLIFTQFQLVLDELEEYCRFRGFRYLRLDGSTNKMIRELDIREFNGPYSTHLVYLICTRAGGVGINLVTANHVVLYDEDWNPFIDLQAIDRAHRIGQRRDVHVWKLMTEWTVEERMAFRRMQKLKLDKLLIQANVNTQLEAPLDETEESGTADNSGDKFSVEEIRRLIRHGRTAIQRVSGQDEDLPSKTLEEIISRGRKDLPVIQDAEEDDEAIHSSDEGPEVSLADALDPEERAVCSAGGRFTEEPRTVSTATEDAHDEDVDVEIEAAEADAPADTAGGGGLDSELEAKKAHRRLRRRTPISFQQTAAAELKPKLERKIIHDKKCFRCGSGVNPTDENVDPLVSCHRCPKVYHQQGCLGFDELPKKTWTCPWHECCLCFRKGSQAGGMLIHCAECPTTFCFDCFPPEYRRYNPPATYYTDLSKRGYPASPEKLVLFLCSRCKALKEQQRRRLLTRQQLEAEARKRKEENWKARVDAQKAKGGDDKASAALGIDKRAPDVKRELQLRKKKIDDLEKEYIREIRMAYEKLFPEEFVELLKEKRARQMEELKTKEGVSKSGTTTKTTKEGIKEEVNAQEGTAADLPSLTPPLMPSTQDDAPSTVDAKSATAKTQGTKLIITKTPSEFCKLCENCHLPGHESVVCAFPPETEKKNLASSSVGNGTEITEEDRAAEKIRGTSKRLIRSFCPKCGVSSRNHFRRHCDQLDAEEIEEYDVRREKIKKLIESLMAATPVDLSGCRSLSYSTAESCRRVLQKHVDEVVSQALCAAGLEACVANGARYLNQQRKESAKQAARRKRKPDGQEAGGETAGDSDDPNYSPRKKSRVLDGAEAQPDDASDVEGQQAGSEGEAQTRVSQRKRRPRPNFRALIEDGEGSLELEVGVSRETTPAKGPSANESPEIGTLSLIEPPRKSAKKRSASYSNAPPPAAPPTAEDERMEYEIKFCSKLASEKHAASAAESHQLHRPAFPKMPVGGSMLPTQNLVRTAAVLADSRLPPSRWHHSPALGVAPGRMHLAAQPMYPPQWGSPYGAAMSRGYYPGPPILGAPAPYGAMPWAPQQFAQFAHHQQVEAWRAQQQQFGNPLLRPPHHHHP